MLDFLDGYLLGGAVLVSLGKIGFVYFADFLDAAGAFLGAAFLD